VRHTQAAGGRELVNSLHNLTSTIAPLEAPRGRWHVRRTLSLVATLALAIVVLGACSIGGDDDDPDDTGGKITWYQGEPPQEIAVALTPEGDQAEGEGSADQQAPEQAQQPPVSAGEQTEETTTEPTPEPEPTATTEPEPTATTGSQAASTGAILTDEEIAQYEPNELGNVPVLMYHNIVSEYGPGQEGDVLWRTIDEFKADLQWLYDNDFYVIPFYDYVTNQISAPAGKKPFVLTFDDSRPNQFYYLIGDDGSVTIDPDSAVGIMEEFFAAHPDFGRTAFFSILPIWCFDFEAPDQTPYCQQKLQWLVDNGYEVGNHTWDHQDLYDVSNQVFQQKIVDTSDFLLEMAPSGTAHDILILPYGNFPGGDNAEQQWQWIRNGWTYEGRDFQLLSVVAAGANPAYSPSSIDFDIMSIARIGAKDYPAEGEADLFFDFWFGQFEERPDLLYTSDGNPDTITFPAGYADMLDEEKAAAEGKEVITY
jgi:hypothetical protein